jgi:methylthioribose-1-phosphate isomerase
VANGDVANKIGTYSAAVLAHHHGARVMVVAPRSTIDLNITKGSDIPIEKRSPDEVLGFGSMRTAAAGSEAWNPVFDVTPGTLIDAIVTEAGVAKPPFDHSIPELMQQKPS